MNQSFYFTEITDGAVKRFYAENVLRTLPEWFGIEDSLAEYVDTVHDLPFFAAMLDDICVGFVSGVIHHGLNGEIYVMGVKPDYHGCGIGKKLVSMLETHFKVQNCAYMMVKTLSPLRTSIHYEQTRHFYAAVGFMDFYTDIAIWGQENPCLIMLKNLV